MVRVSSAFVVVATLFASVFAAPAAPDGYDRVAYDFYHITELLDGLDKFIMTPHSLNGDVVSNLRVFSRGNLCDK
jgi:hypothetical protein